MNAPSVDESNSPDPTDPNFWQTSLISLLARLDHARYALTAYRLGSDAPAIIEQLESMIQEAENLANRTEFSPKHASLRSDTIAKAGAFFMSASTIKGSGSRSFLISNLFRSISGSSEAPEQVRACMFATFEALASYFALFTAGYASPEEARDWEETTTAFLDDFKHLIRKLPVN